ncbi:YqiA/YcfP family alpha/beta fold hydrolase [Pseudodesulfovibrio portus]|uniref:Alpha/beta hydrolase n=1 Tax=Pseudodesulfovibrio portus TaxID=231439 RepID=A0ABM8AQG2_9BACT|nr:YqiA/YcfP family alpha/beta fold hydrolase [Pseudodesulfovibrio portus]BDQ33637.1 alpha/beta hydrolase [Pseudodesulfovibrio portus]
MSDFSLIWCHGSLGRPWGTKSTALAEVAAELGLTMEAPDFRETEDPDKRVAKLVDLLEKAGRPAILAGSSMGGYVAAAAAAKFDVPGLFLLAPAFYFPGYAVHVFSDLPAAVTVVHGWVDDVVPVDNSIRFARTHRADLHVFDDGHRLQGSTHRLRTLFAGFLQGLITAS